MGIKLDEDFKAYMNSFNESSTVINSYNNNESDDDDKKEYIKTIIKESIEQCKEKTKSINTIIEDIELYDPIGYFGFEEAKTFLDQLMFKFDLVIPSLLLGDYDKLLMYERDSDDVEELKRIYDNTRKKIINNIINNK